MLQVAVEKGVRFDGWDESFEFNKWMEAFKECEISPEFYSSRKREYNEVMPWDHLDYGVSKDFLIRENKLAHTAITTRNCREVCSNCGASCYGEGVCYEKR